MNFESASSRACDVRLEAAASMDGTCPDNERADTNMAVPPSGNARPPTTTGFPDKEPPVALPLLLMELEEQMIVEPGNEAYLEALKNAPDVLKTEVNPLQFLRREAMNVAAAARRMCKYWNMRKEAFGDRFARPLLDVSGN